MTYRIRRAVRFGIVAMATAVLIGGCSSMGGLSTWGDNKLSVAEVKNIEAYTAEGALAEGREHFRNGNYGHSATFYKRAAEMQPNSVEAYVGLGASYDQLGRFDLADRVYASLYELSGGTAQYHNNVGYSYMLRGNLTAALTSFRKARSIDPDNLVVANNMQLLANVAASGRA